MNLPRSCPIQRERLVCACLCVVLCACVCAVLCVQCGCAWLHVIYYNSCHVIIIIFIFIIHYFHTFTHVLNVQHTHSHPHTATQSHTHRHTHTHTYTHTHIHTHTHVQTQVQTCIQTQTHMHTHTLNRELNWICEQKADECRVHCWKGSFMHECCQFICHFLLRHLFIMPFLAVS